MCNTVQYISISLVPILCTLSSTLFMQKLKIHSEATLEDVPHCHIYLSSTQIYRTSDASFNTLHHCQPKMKADVKILTLPIKLCWGKLLCLIIQNREMNCYKFIQHVLDTAEYVVTSNVQVLLSSNTSSYSTLFHVLVFANLVVFVQNNLEK